MKINVRQGRKHTKDRKSRLKGQDRWPTKRFEEINAQANAPLNHKHAQENNQVVGGQCSACQMRRKGHAHSGLRQGYKGAGHAKKCQNNGRAVPQIGAPPNETSQYQQACGLAPSNQPIRRYPALCQLWRHQTPKPKRAKHRQVDRKQACCCRHGRVASDHRHPRAGP